MAVSAGTNCMTQAEDALRDMLANTTEFQNWVSAASAAAAKASIYFDDLPEPEHVDITDDEYTARFWESLGNYAVLWTHQEGGFAYDAVAKSSSNDYLGRGMLVVCFNQFFDLESLNTQEDTRTAKNSIGSIVEAMTDLGGLGSYLDVEEFNVSDYYWDDEDKYPTGFRYFRMFYAVSWSRGQQ